MQGLGSKRAGRGSDRGEEAEWRSAIISTDGTGVGLECRQDDELVASFRQGRVNNDSNLDRRWERKYGPDEQGRSSSMVR